MQGAEDLLTGFWREFVEKIDDLLGDFLFEPCGISGSSDFGMRKTHVSGNVPRIVELTADLAFYGSRHLDQSKNSRSPFLEIGRMGARGGYAFL